MQQQYIPPTLTVDSVIFTLINDTLHVLLIQRAQEPFKGKYALPGGYNAAGQTTREALDAVLRRKTSLKTESLQLIEQLYTFDTVARDPRGHAVSVTYLGLGRNITLTPTNTTQSPTFMPVNSLPTLAYDHKSIIDYAIERLRNKVTYTNAVFALLEPEFTLTQLQTVYEAILGEELDKRNFRKKFLSLDLIHETGNMHREGAHRPAKLYAFNKQSLETLSRSFD